MQPLDLAKNVAFFIYLDHHLKINTALNPEFQRKITNNCGTIQSSSYLESEKPLEEF